MSRKIVRTIETGIYELEGGGYRVKVSLGDRKRGLPSAEKTFGVGTGLKEMRRWRKDQLRVLEASPLQTAKGTFADETRRYLEDLAKTKDPRHVTDRTFELAAWAGSFNPRPLHRIRTEEIRRLARTWETAGVAASTVKHRLNALSQLFLWSNGGNREDYNPVRLVSRPSEPPPLDRHVPLEVVQKVLDALWLRAGLNNRGWSTLARALVLATTGIRPSQLERMDPALHILPYIDGEDRKVWVPSGKNGRAGFLPLFDESWRAFKLFVRVEAQGKFSKQSFYKSWMLACKQAEVKPFRPYSLRHTVATNLRATGADVADVATLLGHKDPKTTERYAAPVSEKLRKAVVEQQSAWNNARAALLKERSVARSG